MGLIDVSLLSIVAFFSLYSLTCSVECGVALSFLTGHRKTTGRFFTPLWEVTNVFLVFGFTALAMLFSGALSNISHALLSTLMIGLAALVIRACIVLVIFYWRPDSLPRWLAWAFAACCFTVPLSFAAAGIYFVSGQLFWHSFVGWSLIITALLGMLALGKLFINTDKDPAAAFTKELIFAAWMLLLGSIVPLAARVDLPNTNKAPLLILSSLSIIGLVLALLGLTSRPQLKLWRFGALMGLAAPFLLAWSDRPYLIYGQIRLDSAFSAASYAKAFVVGTIIMLPLIVLGFWMFWKLIINTDKAGA